MHPVPVRAFNKGCTIRLVEIPSNKLLTTAFAGHPVFVSGKRSCMHCSRSKTPKEVKYNDFPEKKDILRLVAKLYLEYPWRK